MMKRLEWFIEDHWIGLCAGALLTAVSVEAAYVERGYMAVGGEWLVLPMVLLASALVKGVSAEIRRLIREGKDNDETFDV